MRTLINVGQYHYLQRDVVSSFHEKITKGENIVRRSRITLDIRIPSDDRVRKKWLLGLRKTSRIRRKNTRPRRVDKNTSKTTTIKTSRKPSS